MTVYEIGPFHLDPETGVLTRLGIAQPLGRRAANVLLALVQKAGAPLTKGSLIDAAWPGLVVEEANLSVQVSAIRRVLSEAPGADRWIETLAGRGYRFVGPVVELRDGVREDPRHDHIGNLPESLTSFVGREHELVELKRLLGRNRLLTLSGVGGIGKTRLAQQLAAEVRDAYRDGVWFVDLAALDDPALVPSTAAQTLGVEPSAGTPIVESLCRHVKGQRLLLILDNCEHVIDAAAWLAEALLRGAAEPTIIATSREPLRIGGEQVYRLAALSLPDADCTLASISASDAVQLFIDRAQHQLPEFALTESVAPSVAKLCLRLDGIALALELASAHVQTLSIDQIEARLDDRFALLTLGSRTALPRQQTLRATLDWSHERLAVNERTLLRRLAVFPAAFSSDAAAAVGCDEALGERTATEALGRLVACSLVIAEKATRGARYRVLETIRAYAAEKLAQAGEAEATRRRHARHFASCFAHANEDWLRRLNDTDWDAIYVPELDNVRAALDASLSTGDSSTAIALAGASGALWSSLSLWDEGMRRLEAAAASIGPDTPPLAAAWLHYSLGIVFDSMPERALSEFERAGALFRSLDDAPALGDCLYRCGRILADRADVQAAEAALVESEKLLQSGDYPKLLAFCRDAVGHLNMHRHDYRAARACFEHALCLFRDAGALQAELVTLNSLADATWALGDLDAAAAAFDAAIQLTRGHPLRRKRDLGFLLLNCAGVLTERGRLDEALDAAREGVPLLRETGYAWIFVDHLACRVALAGGLSDAARLAGFADAGFVAHRRTREPNEARARSRLDALLRERLDTAALGERIAEGAAMGADEAFAIALMPSHQ